MASSRARRILKELSDLNQNDGTGIKIATINDDVDELRGSFPGPPDTPYEGGKYLVHIKVPLEYPFQSPHIQFETKVWHPNVSSGSIEHAKVLKEWSPLLNLKSALLSLQSLLANPNAQDAWDGEVALQMLQYPLEFRTRAREWAVRYAGAPGREPGEGSEGVTPEATRTKIPAVQKRAEEEVELAQYKGYNKSLIDRFCTEGFTVRNVVSAFEACNIDRNDGQYYELEEAYVGDINAYLFDDP
ncbi:hypothetical protein ABW20_dc0104267 [Dactylellina cionopaga]|nr:hypothetical protein ABW20_dc0104267 [Dactylellina cionopaga]